MGIDGSTTGGARTDDAGMAALLAAFGEHGALARELAPHALGHDDDPSHDLTHIVRVWRNVLRIAAAEGGDLRLLAAATLLHDAVAVEKTSPDRPLASRMAAAKARGLLGDLGWEGGDVERVAHAIEAHSFSARIEPLTAEARVLQDADRLDALGAIGVARCLVVSGRLNRRLYDPLEPAPVERAVDEDGNTLDHFYAKLIGLAAGFRTPTGRRLAEVREARTRAFVVDLLDEVDHVE